MNSNDKHRLHTVIMWVVGLVAVFGAVIVFILSINHQMFYLVVVVLMILMLIPIFIAFEKRKPKAREMVLLSVMSALGVVGRAVFFMFPNFKPMVAIVIITAVCFGPQSGFLVGTVTTFVSNIMFGQGVHTVFQMFATALIGLIAGFLFFNKSKKNMIAIAIYGAFSTFVIYGGIVELSGIANLPKPISLSAIISLYIGGFPFNVIHTVSTVFFVLLFGLPLIKILQRIQIKYGIMGHI